MNNNIFWLAINFSLIFIIVLSFCGVFEMNLEFIALLIYLKLQYITLHLKGENKDE